MKTLEELIDLLRNPYRQETMDAYIDGWIKLIEGNLAPKTITPEELDQRFAPCDHTYANYQGLTESYEYCTKCDKKKLS